MDRTHAIDSSRQYGYEADIRPALTKGEHSRMEDTGDNWENVPYGSFYEFISFDLFMLYGVYSVIFLLDTNQNTQEVKKNAN